MPTGLYDLAREAFLNADIDWSVDTVRVVFIDAADYTVNLAADQFLSSVPAGARVGTPTALAGKTSTIGVADANDVVYASLTGDRSEAILIYQDTGVEATSRLIAYIDTGVNLPVTPAGSAVTIAWSNGATRIFRL